LRTAGYRNIGYEEGGQLTEALKGDALLLCGPTTDEIEEAHPEVFDTLFQILEP
jgi:ATP-dependent Clp protease ATP-binding subunit ClpA